MNKSILFLDDDKQRCKFFKSHYPYAKIVTNAKDCCEELLKNEFDLVLLDHDLGGKIFVDEKEENTGSEVVSFIIKKKIKIGKIIIHSLNYHAAMHMLLDLQDHLYSVDFIPFLKLTQEIKNNTFVV